jgi:transposase
MSIKRVAELSRLGWQQVHDIECAYMRRLLAKQPISDNLEAIGIDEISVRKGHSYQIVVADLNPENPHPIWMGGTGRTEDDMKLFYSEIGEERSKGIRLAVMDMWKPFRKATNTYSPQALIVFDKFHVLRHLSDALDHVRRQEYHRVSDKERTFIKGQRYTLLSHHANLTTDGRRSLKLLLKANKRLHTAYLLKESFGQLWDYRSSACARRFFENWKRQLRWQKLEPFK